MYVERPTCQHVSWPRRPVSVRAKQLSRRRSSRRSTFLARGRPAPSPCVAYGMPSVNNVSNAVCDDRFAECRGKFTICCRTRIRVRPVTMLSVVTPEQVHQDALRYAVAVTVLMRTSLMIGSSSFSHCESVKWSSLITEWIVAAESQRNGVVV